MFAKTLCDEYNIQYNNIGVGSTPTCANLDIHETTKDPTTNLKTKAIDLNLIQNVYTDNLIMELHDRSYLVYNDMKSIIIHSFQPSDVDMFVKTQVIFFYLESSTLMVNFGWTGLSIQDKSINSGYVIPHLE